LTLSLKAPGFNPRTYEVISWFQNVPFKFNLRHYTAAADDDEDTDVADIIKRQLHSCITDCHLSVCTLDPPVNMGAPDGRMAHAAMLVMVPEDDLTAPWWGCIS
jgi:hypothetical protein